MAGTSLDPVNGHAIKPLSSAPLALTVTNTDTAGHLVTIKAGSAPHDLIKPVLSGRRERIDFDPASYLQADGTVWVDLEPGHTGQAWVTDQPELPTG